ncbi:MAG: nitrate reductase subunit beta [SAR202 cluster bacterium]|nr:nitrate reductase subunit beta [Chloroflexota bacterium]MDP6420379.1 nitrate reductase subunit beta [SAR202 cluster bacterium]HAL46335.1 nitrate reductase subunit beta [Dehalococcoidia bacterium]MDP6663439.1 nitrate reductase subunit beta [SAR202 cluster bacterium]MDP6800082.1 nitrate reductase subunit beta [SAR202 cluster bacterium]
MDIRSQVSMVFHLDKCIGCHTCSIACKNIWTDREGTEYQWWNNVETKPGTGYPTLWENQDKYKGGWELDEGKKKLKLKLQGKWGALGNIFSNPNLPTMDDYYEPWTYDYQNLFNAPEGDDQPTARAISLVTGKFMEIESGPNWDDDLGGSPVYASNDPNLENVTDEERSLLNEIERMVFFYLPRICNHCLNAGCVGACPAGAVYKRGEDGVVLINQEKCRAWRMCVTGCPYKKTYFNWSTGKSEKCILCFPRLESGQPPACFHSCVGRIRYLGLLLYDADQIEDATTVPERDLVNAHRNIIQDPFDPEVIASAKANGLSDQMIKAAQDSPVYKFVKTWGLALPLHSEFRTMPMLFYVPPMLPVLAGIKDGHYEISGVNTEGLVPLLSSLEEARIPIRFMASLFSAGNEEIVKEVYRKLIAVRIHMRSKTVNDIPAAEAAQALAQAGTTAEEVEAIYRLTALPTYQERFVVPPMAREVAIEQTLDPSQHKPAAGFGFRKAPQRRW